MTNRRSTIPIALNTFALATAAGLALLLVLATPTTARQRNQPSPAAIDPGLRCPDGWKPTRTPPVSGQLECLPGKFVAGSRTDPAVAQSKPELFCPPGWKPTAPPVNRQLECLPDQMARGSATRPLVVQLPRLPRKPLVLIPPASPPPPLKGIEGSPIGTAGAPGTRDLSRGTNSYQLMLLQKSAKAEVPMKHGSCGLDCGIHVLASAGNLNLPFDIGMTCPAGTTVVDLAAGGTTVLQADSGQASFSKTVNLQPFTAQELETACQTALGGGWALPNSHSNTSPTTDTSVSETIKVSGRCSGWANTVYQDFQASLSVTCKDQDFHYPVP